MVVAETKEASLIEKPLLFAPMTLGAGAGFPVGFSVLGNPVRLKFVLCAPKPAPDLLALAGIRHPARDVESVHVSQSC